MQDISQVVFARSSYGDARSGYRGWGNYCTVVRRVHAKQPRADRFYSRDYFFQNTYPRVDSGKLAQNLIQASGPFQSQLMCAVQTRPVSSPSGYGPDLDTVRPKYCRVLPLVPMGYKMDVLVHPFDGLCVHFHPSSPLLFSCLLDFLLAGHRSNQHSLRRTQQDSHCSSFLPRRFRNPASFRNLKHGFQLLLLNHRSWSPGR